MSGIQRPRTPVDETLWRDPSWYRAYGPLTQNNVMQYFHQSPFFDSVSNNGDLMSQIELNVQIRMKITSQEAFDNHLKKMRGVEYMPVMGSQDTGVWVIHKQDRKSPTQANILATYYIAGENMYQAPTVGAVLENHLLTISHMLRNCLRAANTLSAPVATAAATSENRGTPAPSQTSSQPPASSQPPSTQGSAAPQPSKPKSKERIHMLLMHQAIRNYDRHAGETIDDLGPLLGDPGSLLVQQPQTQQSQSQRSHVDSISRSGTATPGMRGSVAPDIRTSFRK